MVTRIQFQTKIITGIKMVIMLPRLRIPIMVLSTLKSITEKLNNKIQYKLQSQQVMDKYKMVILNIIILPKMVAYKSIELNQIVISRLF